MKRLYLDTVVVAICASGLSHATPDSEEVNHCQESEVNQEWAALADEHHDSDTWQRLFALRIGLCAMVERGDLTVHRASQIFERQRQDAIRNVFDSRPAPSEGGL